MRTYIIDSQVSQKCNAVFSILLNLFQIMFSITWNI